MADAARRDASGSPRPVPVLHSLVCVRQRTDSPSAEAHPRARAQLERRVVTGFAGWSGWHLDRLVGI